MAERHGRILGELSELGHDLAKKLHGQAMAAETPAETAELARAFHSVARSVRQTLALEARLARDAARQDREDRTLAERQAGYARLEAQQAVRAPHAQRRNRIGAVLERTIRTTYDEAEAERLLDEVEDRLLEEEDAPDFLDEAVDDQIARLCRDFGLPLPERRLEPPPAAPSPPVLDGQLNGAGQSP